MTIRTNPEDKLTLYKALRDAGIPQTKANRQKLQQAVQAAFEQQLESASWYEANHLADSTFGQDNS